MTLAEITQAVSSGAPVKWVNGNYDVIKDCLGQYLIVCRSNDHAIGLTWLDGVTVNGRPEDFYVAGKDRS